MKNRVFSRSAAVKIALTALKYSRKMVDAIYKNWFHLSCLFFCDIATVVGFPIFFCLRHEKFGILRLANCVMIFKYLLDTHDTHF